MNQHDNIAASLKHLVLLSFFGPANFLGVGARFVFFGLGEHGCEWTLALGFYGTGLERVLERYGTRSGTGSKNGGIQNQMQMPMQLEVGTGFFYLQSRFGVDALQVVFQRRSPRPRVILVDLILFILDHVSKMGDPSCRNILERGSVWIVSRGVTVLLPTRRSGRLNSWPLCSSLVVQCVVIVVLYVVMGRSMMLRS